MTNNGGFVTPGSINNLLAITIFIRRVSGLIKKYVSAVFLPDVIYYSLDRYTSDDQVKNVFMKSPEVSKFST